MPLRSQNADNQRILLCFTPRNMLLCVTTTFSTRFVPAPVVTIILLKNTSSGLYPVVGGKRTCRSDTTVRLEKQFRGVIDRMSSSGAACSRNISLQAPNNPQLPRWAKPINFIASHRLNWYRAPVRETMINALRVKTLRLPYTLRTQSVQNAHGMKS